MPYSEYFVIYAISKGVFRVVSDKETRSIQFYNTYNEAKEVKEKLANRNPHVKFHIRTFRMEQKFLKEFED